MVLHITVLYCCTVLSWGWQEEFDRQLKAMCLMIEARLGELTGKVDLNHGAYFRDPRILKCIAFYITNRCLPEWSREIDVDISRMDQHLGRIVSAHRSSLLA